MEKAAVEAMRGGKSLDETDFVAAVVIGVGAVWVWDSEGEIWRVGMVGRVVFESLHALFVYLVASLVLVWVWFF